MTIQHVESTKKNNEIYIATSLPLGVSFEAGKPIVLLLYWDYNQKDYLDWILPILDRIEFIVITGQSKEAEVAHDTFDELLVNSNHFASTVTMEDDDLEQLAYFFLNACFFDDRPFISLALVQSNMPKAKELIDNIKKQA